MNEHAPEHIVDTYLAAAKSSEGVIEAIALGGSRSQQSQDMLSDVDLFVFCSDELFAKAVEILCGVRALERLDRTSFVSGPHLFDGYGICYRTFINYVPIIDLFIVTPATWSATPGREKLHFVYLSESHGKEWESRVDARVQAQHNKGALLAHYFLNSMLAELANASKMLGRGEVLGASVYVHRLQVALEAAKQAAGGARFLPDRHLATLSASQGQGAVDNMRFLLIQALHSPRDALRRVIEGWLELLCSPHCREAAVDAISALEHYEREV